MANSAPILARVTRHYAAPPERVFAAWLDPALIGAWMFGPGVRDEAVVRIAVDARVGGSFSFVVRRQGQEFDHIGEYLELDRPHRLAFTWGVRQEVTEFSRVSIDIVPAASGCDLTLTHAMQLQWADFVPHAEASWGTMLDSLARLLESQAN